MKKSDDLSYWKKIRQQLEITEAKINHKKKADLDQELHILKKRARSLARKKKTKEHDQSCIEVVEFFLAHERYAIELIYIQEVYPLKYCTRVPGTPDFLIGIVNIRGQMISVVDLKNFFDLPDQGISEGKRIIILQSDNLAYDMEFAVLADEIVGVSRIPLDQIQSIPTTFTGSHEVPDPNQLFFIK